MLRSTYHVFDLYVNYMGDTVVDLWSEAVPEMEVTGKDESFELSLPARYLGETAVIYRLFRSSVRTRLRRKNLDPSDPQLTARTPFSDEDLEESEGEQQKIDQV